jgi:acyl-CoA dehydrogenase
LKDSLISSSSTELYREVPGARIPGGSEDVMLDLAIRQIAKRFKEKSAVISARKSLL